MTGQKSFYYLRHGESSANAQYVVSGDSVELTEKGRQQARDAAEQLKDKDIQLILTSGLIRAQQTAEIVAQVLGIENEVKTIDILHERTLGDFVGQPRPDNEDFFYAIDGENNTETRSSLIARATAVLKEVESYAQQTEGNVLVVGHAILGFYLRQAAAGITEYSDFDWGKKIRNAEIIEIGITS